MRNSINIGDALHPAFSPLWVVRRISRILVG
jgi:hypothetical protein